MADTTRCAHKHTTTGRERCYSGSVAGPRGDENRAAHGNITYTETCQVCGAERAANVNGMHYEYSPWGPSAAEQEREARRERTLLRERLMAPRTIAGHRVQLNHASQAGADVTIDGAYRYLSMAELLEAAEQRDTGDGLVPFYGGLLTLVQSWLDA